MITRSFNTKKISDKNIVKLSYLHHNLICRQQKKLCTSVSVHVYNRNCGIHVYKNKKNLQTCIHNYQTCTHNFHSPRVHKFPKLYMYISSLVHLISFLKNDELGNTYYLASLTCIVE